MEREIFCHKQQYEEQGHRRLLVRSPSVAPVWVPEPAHPAFCGTPGVEWDSLPSTNTNGHSEHCASWHTADIRPGAAHPFQADTLNKFLAPVPDGSFVDA